MSRYAKLFYSGWILVEIFFLLPLVDHLFFCVVFVNAILIRDIYSADIILSGHFVYFPSSYITFFYFRETITS